MGPKLTANYRSSAGCVGGGRGGRGAGGGAAEGEQRCGTEGMICAAADAAAGLLGEAV